MTADPLNAHIRVEDGQHRGRRAEDHEEREIRFRIWERWLAAFARETPHTALMAALDEYKRELGMLAIKRLGIGAMK
jgi:hypothetical protein